MDMTAPEVTGGQPSELGGFLAAVAEPPGQGRGRSGCQVDVALGGDDFHSVAMSPMSYGGSSVSP